VTQARQWRLGCRWGRGHVEEARRGPPHRSRPAPSRPQALFTGLELAGPDAPAFVGGPRGPVTFAVFAGRVVALRRALAAPPPAGLGLGPGDVMAVALHAPASSSGPAVLELWLAAAALGAVLAPLPREWGLKSIEAALRRVGAAALVVDGPSAAALFPPDAAAPGLAATSAAADLRTALAGAAKGETGSSAAAAAATGTPPLRPPALDLEAAMVAHGAGAAAAHVAGVVPTKTTMTIPSRPRLDEPAEPPPPPGDSSAFLRPAPPPGRAAVRALAAVLPLFPSPPLLPTAAGGEGRASRPARVDPPSLIVHTSGSTEGPRAAILGARAICWQSAVKAARLPGLRRLTRAVDGASGPTVALHPAPLSHVGGLSTAHAALSCGCAGAFLDGGWSGRAFLDACARLYVTHASVVPAMLHDAAVAAEAEAAAGTATDADESRARDTQRGAALATLRSLLVGAGPLAPGPVGRLTLAAGLGSNRSCVVWTAYGLTETASSLCWRRHCEESAAPSDVGSPASGAEVVVSGADGAWRPDWCPHRGPPPAPWGTVGEVWMRGAPAMQAGRNQSRQRPLSVASARAIRSLLLSQLREPTLAPTGRIFYRLPSHRAGLPRPNGALPAHVARARARRLGPHGRRREFGARRARA